jgi:hypothetical protein
MTAQRVVWEPLTAKRWIFTGIVCLAWELL